MLRSTLVVLALLLTAVAAAKFHAHQWGRATFDLGVAALLAYLAWRRRRRGSTLRA